MPPPSPSPRAFTLVEIMVVVVIIGILAALAISGIRRAQARSNASRLANDFRQYAGAFQQYSIAIGSWPAATTAAGEIPANMTGFLPTAYSSPSPLGGGYTWSGPSARLRLINTQATDAVMQRVDALIDDGNLSTGDFSKMLSGGYHLQLR